MKKIFAIHGSAADASANLAVLKVFQDLTKECFDVTLYSALKSLPHFDPLLSIDHPPQEVLAFRQAIADSDGVVFCTPEYVFSIPAGLKNALEWCVATTVFTDKPVGIITASASGQAGHESLQRICTTLGARLCPGAALLISGVKGKVDEYGALHPQAVAALKNFIASYQALLS